ncbi:putative galactolipase [Helianthus debilis subsp. tardiflorus]
MGEIAKQLIHKNEDYPLSLDYGRYLVISVGTGECKMEGGKYTTEEASKWGLLGWWFNANWCTPLVDILTQASTDMVDIHLSVVFKTLGVEKNYLRIQEDGLERTLSPLDRATDENLKSLMKAGEKLLEKKVSTVNLENGKFEFIPDRNETNSEALRKFAKKLSKEKRRRDHKAPQV